MTWAPPLQVPVRHAGLTPAAIEHQGESLSDFEIACKIGERFGVREEIDKGMSDDMWIETAFQSSRLVEEIDWDTYKEKGYYYPKLEENWEQMAPGMRNFYENPEEYPLDTPTGKIEFWSQALADNFPDDKERTPMARWIVGRPRPEEGWTHDETFWGERCKKYPLLVTANPAKWRVHVQGDDIKWFREIETCKVKGKDGLPLRAAVAGSRGRRGPRHRGRRHSSRCSTNAGTILVRVRASPSA